MKIIFMLSIILCSFTSQAVELKTPAGYVSEAVTYAGDKTKAGVVFLHGKSGRPDAGFLEDLFRALSNAGHTVIAPTMPWSRDKREGTLKDAMQIIDAAILYLSDKSKGVVVMGHSMGAMNTMIYASRQPAKQVIGIALIAPGHMPHISNKLLEITAASVAKVRQLYAEGKAKDKDSFEDLNAGQSESFTTSVEYYREFYDPEVFPDVNKVMPQIKVPVLWISGKKDRLTQLFDHAAMFESISKHEKNRYEIIKGNHKSVVKFSGATINEWLASLQ